MINIGIDFYTVVAVLGHRTPLSTKRYRHFATQMPAAAVAPIDRKCTVPVEKSRKLI